jgi:hypothetical protein
MRVTYFPCLSIKFSPIFDGEPILGDLHHDVEGLQAAAMVKLMRVRVAMRYWFDKRMDGKSGTESDLEEK